MADSETPCYFFTKLPAELRMDIYELVFTSDTTPSKFEPKDEIDLLKSSPPSKNFLLTCRKVNTEASKVYKISYQQFWTSQKLDIAIKANGPYEEYEQIKALSAIDLEHVTDLTMTSTETCRGSLSLTCLSLFDKRGIWHEYNTFKSDEDSQWLVTHLMKHPRGRRRRNQNGRLDVEIVENEDDLEAEVAKSVKMPMIKSQILCLFG